MKKGIHQVGCILLWMLWPIISFLTCVLIANVLDCTSHEGSGAQPCIVAGLDIGGLLYNLAVMGWLFLFTLPSGFIGLIVFLIASARRNPSDEIRDLSLGP